MYKNGVTDLPTNCCFSELELSNSVCSSSIKETSSSSRQNVTCSRHDMAEKLLIWH